MGKKRTSKKKAAKAGNGGTATAEKPADGAKASKARKQRLKLVGGAADVPVAPSPYVPPLPRIDDADLRLAESAEHKWEAGKTATRAEAAAHKRVENLREEIQRWEHYQTIPQKHWIHMAGRGRKVIVEQAKAHGLPFDTAVISLPAFVHALHDFLAANARRLSDKMPTAIPGVDPNDEMNLFLGGDSPALERFRNARANLAELEFEVKKENFVDREHLRESFALVASVLRRAGEQLQKQFGPEAQEILDEALDDVVNHVEKLMAKKDEERKQDE